MKIVIPSYKRAGKVKALINIPEDIQTKYYWLAVRPEEYSEYKSAYPYCNIKALEGNVNGVTQTRQRINEQFSGIIVVIDDDVHFVKNHLIPYPKGWRGRYHKVAKERDFTSEDYDDLSNWLDTYTLQNPYGAIRASQFLLTEEKWPRWWNAGLIWAIWFNLDLFDYKFYDYTKGPEFIEDVFLSLMWYDNGNDAPTTLDWGIIKSAGTGDEDGGCNHHPNRSKSHNASADWLFKHYPDYVWLRDSPKYLKTMGAKTNTVETRLRQEKRNRIGEYSNKPINEFPITKPMLPIEPTLKVLWYEDGKPITRKDLGLLK